MGQYATSIMWKKIKNKLKSIFKKCLVILKLTKNCMNKLI